MKERIDALQIELNGILGTLAQVGDAVTPRKKRKVSAVARARMRAAQRARWAKLKGTTPVTSTARKPKRRMSAAAKARLAAIAKARWRKAKAAGKTRL